MSDIGYNWFTMLEEIAYIAQDGLFDILLGMTLLTLLAPVATLVAIRLVINGLSNPAARFSLLMIALAVLLGSLLIFDFVRRYLTNTVPAEFLFVLMVLLIFAALLGSRQAGGRDN